MLKIRLQRVGRKHEPAFRLVLTDSKNSTKSGRFNEILGSYDPRKGDGFLKKERIEHWLGKGISVTGSVHNLLVSHKVIDDKKVNVLPKKTPIIKEAPVAEETPAADEAPALEEATVEEAEPVEESNPVVEAPAEETKEESKPVEEASEASTEEEKTSESQSE
jgi:small subunit ribosomal protein S16